MNGWVPCNKDLPRSWDGEVLCLVEENAEFEEGTFPIRTIYTGKFNMSLGWLIRTPGGRLEFVRSLHAKVLAWMPLPSLYEVKP